LISVYTPVVWYVCVCLFCRDRYFSAEQPAPAAHLKRCMLHGEVSRGEKMFLQGIDPDPRITEHTQVHAEYTPLLRCVFVRVLATYS